MITDASQTRAEILRHRTHPNCVVCSRNNPCGLGLQFDLRKDGSVEAAFHCAKAFEGYCDLLHGGVIASLLDGAMTNCLFAHNQVAVTAELTIRYRHPVQTDQPARIRAWIDRSTSTFFLLKAELFQEGQRRVTAKGKFLAKKEWIPADE